MEPPKKKAKLSIESFTTPLKVIVGKEKTVFYVAKNAICEYSAFFKTACNEQWECGRTNTVTLEEDNPEIFSIFLAWLMTGDSKEAAELIISSFDLLNTDFQDPSKIEDKAKAQNEIKHQFRQLCKCFVLGDALQAPLFCNHAMDMILENAKTLQQKFSLIAGTNDYDISYVFSNTVKGSPLRRFIVDSYCRASPDRPVKELKLSGMGEFYGEVAHQALKYIRTKKLADCAAQKNPCNYHIHKDQPEGYTCS